MIFQTVVIQLNHMFITR